MHKNCLTYPVEFVRDAFGESDALAKMLLGGREGAAVPRVFIVAPDDRVEPFPDRVFHVPGVPVKTHERAPLINQKPFGAPCLTATPVTQYEIPFRIIPEYLPEGIIPGPLIYSHKSTDAFHPFTFRDGNLIKDILNLGVFRDGAHSVTLAHPRFAGLGPLDRLVELVTHKNFFL